MAVIKSVFLDTSVLLQGLIDFGERSKAPMQVFDAVVEGEIERASTAWHCCLELYSVSTRLPIEWRISPLQAFTMLRDELIPHLTIVQLPQQSLETFLTSAMGEQIMGGRIYDAHIAEIAKSAAAEIVVTDNQRHFTHLLKEKIQVLTAAQFATRL